MAAASTNPDDLEAVRIVVDALKPFPADDQRRILRWAQEKVGLSPQTLAPSPAMLTTPAVAQGPAETSVASTDVRSFIQRKQPSSDVQFATAVAYYFAFEAPPGSRKEEIGPDDLQESARLAARTRLKQPAQTLRNARQLGYLDKGSGPALFRVNTVGENLVAMAMPEGANQATTRTRNGRKTGKSARGAHRKATRTPK